MATPSQINANQVNAQQSTGPRSPEGKARVAQNALRHGLTARHLFLSISVKVLGNSITQILLPIP